MTRALVTLNWIILFSVFVSEAGATRDLPPPNASSIHTFPDERIGLHFAKDGQHYYAFFFEPQFSSPPGLPNTDIPLAFRFQGPKGTQLVNAREIATIKAGPTAGMATVTLRNGSSVSVRHETISIWDCRQGSHDNLCSPLQDTMAYPENFVSHFSMSEFVILSADEIAVDIDDAYQSDLKLLSDAPKIEARAAEESQHAREASQRANEASRAAEMQRRDASINAERAKQEAANAALVNQFRQQPIGSTLFCSTEPHWNREPGDAVDRQRFLCHLAGQPDFPPVMGAALLTSGCGL
jgi:hypothetical protein